MVRRRSQPHRFSWPLTPQQMQDMDDTFQILFDELKRVDDEQHDASFIPAHASSHGSAGSDPVTIAESQVVGLTADLASKVPNTRQIISGAGLTGGGDLSADRTLAVGAGTNIASNADDVAVTPQPGAASRLLGRGSASSGAWEVISLGSGISMSGTTLNASGTAVAGYTHTQGSANTTWTVSHNLGTKQLAITITDGSDVVVIPSSITYTDTNTITVTFTTSMSGFAYVVG